MISSASIGRHHGQRPGQAGAQPANSCKPDLRPVRHPATGPDRGLGRVSVRGLASATDPAEVTDQVVETDQASGIDPGVEIDPAAATGPAAEIGLESATGRAMDKDRASASGRALVTDPATARPAGATVRCNVRQVCGRPAGGRLGLARPAGGHPTTVRRAPGTGPATVLAIGRAIPITVGGGESTTTTGGLGPPPAR